MKNSQHTAYSNPTELSTTPHLDSFKTSITDVISRYVDLRLSGKEFVALCPFHAEKSPSFTVNEEKGVFHCFGCGEGGDLIRFIEKIENVDFKGALAHLGLVKQAAPTRAERTKRETLRQASRTIAAWALSVSNKIAGRIREAGQREYMARKVLRELPGADQELLNGEIERATREWAILGTLEEDILDPDQTATLWKDREAIDRLVDARVEGTEDYEAMFPSLSEEYRHQLRSYVGGEA